MKNYCFLLLLVVLFSCNSENKGSYESLKPKEFNTAMQQDKDCILLDVRTQEEIAESSLEGNIAINYHDADFKQQVDKLDHNKTCYIYCRSGNRSGKAGKMMVEDLHFKKVVNLDGGIVEWIDEGLPVK
jgi:rhodanese-related sulfurtransferase